MELLALGKPIKKPPRSDERDGDLFCGTAPVFSQIFNHNGSGTYTFTDDYTVVVAYCTSSGYPRVSYSGSGTTYHVSKASEWYDDLWIITNVKKNDTVTFSGGTGTLWVG